MASHSYTFGKKLQFLAESVGNLHLAARNVCPSCASRRSEVVARKYLVTSLRRCGSCQILFRAPTTSPASMAKFHSSRYRQGTVTDIPSEEEIEILKKRQFRDSFMDYSDYIKVLKALGLAPASTILELGCSWGYGCWQMQQEGFSVIGVEVSPDRASYARTHMGIDTRLPDNLPKQSCDVFFSSHVLEHIPEFSKFRRMAWEILKSGGYFVAVNPNGCLARRAIDTTGWTSAWGFIHPLLFDDQFFRKEFGANVQYMGTDWRQLAHGDLAEAIQSGRNGRLDGSELIIVARKG